MGWDVFAWIGLRRFGRHLSVPQMRAELKDSLGIALSDEVLEQSCHRDQTLLADRDSDMERLTLEYPRQRQARVSA